MTDSPISNAPTTAIDGRNAESNPTEIASSLDALYFAHHPGINSRVRPIINGEYHGVDTAPWTHVLVEQYMPGLRTRRTCRLVALDAGANGTAGAR